MNKALEKLHTFMLKLIMMTIVQLLIGMPLFGLYLLITGICL